MFLHRIFLHRSLNVCIALTSLTIGFNVREYNDVDPGLQAAKDGDLVKLREFVSSGSFDPILAEDRNGCNALHWAAGEGHLEVCKYLVDECSVDVNELRGRMKRLVCIYMMMILSLHLLLCICFAHSDLFYYVHICIINICVYVCI